MLLSLRIKNVALIDEASIEFSEGLNILSGETGAGKSMIIDSINFVLGEKIDKDFIRSGADSALVEALFTIQEADGLQELGIDVEEDGAVLITRSVNARGKSVFRLNGNIATAAIVKKISENLIDIHGQHQHQSLLNPAKHIELLDRLCPPKLACLKEAFTNVYKEYKMIEKEIHDISIDEDLKTKRIEMIKFHKEEIDDACLMPNEEEELAERKKILSSSEKIARLGSEVVALLYEGERDDDSALDKISKASSNLSELAQLDSHLENAYNLVEETYAVLYDATDLVRHYMDSVEEDPHAINEVEERLNLIYKLKRKYGKSIEEILQYNEKITKELNIMENSEEALLMLNKQMKEKEAALLDICCELHAIRQTEAMRIEKNIEKELSDLGMKKAKFKILVEEKEEFTAAGKDKVEFLIAPNLGEGMKPLAKTASGGEASRVMLALKTALSGADAIDTFIFDEIDTGVSGRTAQKVAERLSAIGREHQIICITHLPQIASMADSHFLIEKRSGKNKTTTNVLAMNTDEMIKELARLIGGAKITDATLIAAKEMKELADNYKTVAHPALNQGNGNE